MTHSDADQPTGKHSPLASISSSSTRKVNRKSKESVRKRSATRMYRMKCRFERSEQRVDPGSRPVANRVGRVSIRSRRRRANHPGSVDAAPCTMTTWCVPTRWSWMRTARCGASAAASRITRATPTSSRRGRGSRWSRVMSMRIRRSADGRLDWRTWPSGKPKPRLSDAETRGSDAHLDEKRLKVGTWAKCFFCIHLTYAVCCC